ncbi:adenine phosphoribosyltransferase [Candidatus Woesearchaeota archaeon]|nr:adenine phosphoribosyltransferase [Candidatus Woesearchaeota archaeon]
MTRTEVQEEREVDNTRIIKKAIRTIPNFPKKGIMFRDITTLLQNPKAFKKTCDALYKRYKGKKIDVVVAIESRGFIFGSVLAYMLGVGFVPVRKPGKLPHKTIREEYELEYGKDAVEMHADAISKGQRVLIIDDLIATGGTVAAAIKLVEKLGGKVLECCFVVELPELKGRQKIKGYPIFNLVEFEGE